MNYTLERQKARCSGLVFILYGPELTAANACIEAHQKLVQKKIISSLAS